MRRPRLLLPGALLLAATLAAPAQAGEASAPERPAEPAGKATAAAALPAPYRAVRDLQALQDRVARGSAAAQAEQRGALDRAAAAFAAADVAAWKEPRNADAAALYLFGAGRASAVRALVERGAAFAPERDRLVKGALAYAEGQDDVARALLGGYDPRVLPPSLGGHLALVTATLFADKDPARADAMLDAARLLVPGTLVEEAALRRQIFLVADRGAPDRFAALARQYLRRFRGSVFAGNFRARLSSYGARLATAGDVAQLAKLDPVLAELPPAERRASYLALSRDALVAGRPEAARHAAARVEALAPDPAEAERARFYLAAAGAASSDAPAARAALEALDPARLPARDADLREAALAVAAGVDAGLGDRGQDVAGAAAPDTPTAALLARARRAFAAGDDLLAAEVGPPGRAAPAAISFGGVQP